MFADKHIDVKFFEEAESDLILLKKLAQKSQKSEFFQDIFVFQHFGVP